MLAITASAEETTGKRKRHRHIPVLRGAGQPVRSAPTRDSASRRVCPRRVSAASAFFVPIYENRPSQPKNVERTHLGTFKLFSQDEVMVAGGESFRTSFLFVIPKEIEPSPITTLGTTTWRVEVWGSVVNGFNGHLFVINVT